jgi:hypothetical protein
LRHMKFTSLKKQTVHCGSTKISTRQDIWNISRKGRRKTTRAHPTYSADMRAKESRLQVGIPPRETRTGEQGGKKMLWQHYRFESCFTRIDNMCNEDPHVKVEFNVFHISTSSEKVCLVW